MAERARQRALVRKLFKDLAGDIAAIDPGTDVLVGEVVNLLAAIAFLTIVGKDLGAARVEAVVISAFKKALRKRLAVNGMAMADAGAVVH